MHQGNNTHPDTCIGGNNEVRRKHSWWIVIHGFVGLGALIWFLIRVIPKPSRASYPCQRVAFPIASSLVIWLVSIFGSMAVLRRAKKLMQLRLYSAAALCFALAVAILWFSLNHTQAQKAQATDPIPNTPIGTGSSLSASFISEQVNDPIPNNPVGTTKGIHPGRVVWIYDPNATNWEETGHPWELTCTSQAVVNKMVSQSIRAVTGQADLTEAWEDLFRHFNQTHQRGDTGYQPGEKITIKVNLTTCNQSLGNVRTNYDKVDTPDYQLLDSSDTSPALIVAVLKQLVEIVGVNPQDIWVGDTLTYFPNQWWNICHAAYPEVHYFDWRGRLEREKLTLSSIRQFWSGETVPSTHNPDYIPSAYAQATYLINLAVLKSHEAGVTLCAKNHYGSYMRSPPGTTNNQFDLHNSLAFLDPNPSHYRALVDIMGHPHMGGKTLLYVLDGLYAGHTWQGTPEKFQMEPFNNDWPSSLFVSQDPVAIDSVGLDFLWEEWPDEVRIPAVDDYLHEAAQANNPPSGIYYDPNGDRQRLSSLGVHEHWNNAIDKQYSRNLGTGYGIELVFLDNNNVVQAACEDPLIFVNQPVHLWGTITDEEHIYPPGAVTWSMISGPGSAIFSDPNDLNSTVLFDTPGDYVLRLTANDGDESHSDEITILVPEQIELSLSQFIATPGSTPGTDRCKIRGTIVFDESPLSIGTHIALQIGPWSEIISIPNPYMRHLGSGHNYIFNGPTSQGAQLMITITKGNRFFLTLRNADLAGLQSPVNVRFSGGNFHAITTVTTPQNVKFLKGIEDTLRLTHSYYQSGGNFNLKGTLAAESYQETLTSASVYLNGELLAQFPSTNEPTTAFRKKGLKYTYRRNRNLNPSGKVDYAVFDLDKCTVQIQWSKAPALTGTINTTLRFENASDEVFYEASDSFSVP